MQPVSISKEAIEEIKHIFEAKNIPSDYCLRVGVKGANGCSGAVSYLLGFDQYSEEDERYEIEGIQVVISKKDFMHLIGVKVSFISDAETRGFTFSID